MYFNSVINNNVLAESVILSLIAMKTKKAFYDDLAQILRQNEYETQAYTSNVQKSSRFQLRDHVSRIVRSDNIDYNVSFNHWCSTMNFSNLTNSRRREFLYFFLAQNVDANDFKDFFSESELQKLSSQLPVYDASCLIRVIHSVRVYNYQIPDLLDFRQECLNGLSIMQRKKLTIPEMVKLYISCWQHESIRQECWKSVINVWNHTIASNCAKFRQCKKYHLREIMDLLVSIYKLDLEIA